MVIFETFLKRKSDPNILPNAPIAPFKKISRGGGACPRIPLAKHMVQHIAS